MGNERRRCGEGFVQRPGPRRFRTHGHLHRGRPQRLQRRGEQVKPWGSPSAITTRPRSQASSAAGIRGSEATAPRAGGAQACDAHHGAGHPQTAPTSNSHCSQAPGTDPLQTQREAQLL